MARVRIYDPEFMASFEDLEGVGFGRADGGPQDSVFIEPREVRGVELPGEDVVFGRRVEVVDFGSFVVPVLEGVGEAAKEHDVGRVVAALS